MTGHVTVNYEMYGVRRLNENANSQRRTIEAYQNTKSMSRIVVVAELTTMTGSVMRHSSAVDSTTSQRNRIVEQTVTPPCTQPLQYS
ncbi:hypothetical protein FOZ62_029642 [Perkinsus olseni]|uniref:Uncharacterized protein n=1 Tax=Perkinsus olseni TaxID=32597 RepID=A0A7J6Q299_PEROL|nr:hypothetical protein FOZ62_029642 [Perkinsus olseni]